MIELSGVTKLFNRGTPTEVAAIDSVDLRFEGGEFVTIIGSNGSGKTTLLNVIAGAHRVDRGSIAIDGVDVTHQPEYIRSRAIGRVYQDPLMGTAPGMTVEENLALASLRARAPRLRFAVTRAVRVDFEGRLADSGLGATVGLKDRVTNLSGGQRQALALVVATLTKPRVLLLDEHCASLDPGMAKTVMAMTSRLVVQDAVTTLMVTHNIQDALAYGTRLLMMHQGRIVVDVRGDVKRLLTLSEIVDLFRTASDEGDLPNRALL